MEKTYEGSCHCGKVRYTATFEMGKVISCNCSMCGRMGSLLTFVPAEKFELLSGEDSLQDYRFNKEQIAHLFCKTCGVRSFGRGSTPDGKAMYAVNVRCLEGVDPLKLDIQHVDGRSY